MTYDAEPTEAEERDTRRSRPRQSGTGVGARQDRLWEAAEVLDNSLDGLHHRLGPVLLPERPSPALGSVGQDSPDTSEHALFLDNLTSKIESVGRRVAELSERVDL